MYNQRIPKSAKVLACTSTNKAIDSLVSKLESSGVSEILTVGSAESMGECAQNYLMPAKLARDPTIARAATILQKATTKREIEEQIVATLAKPKKPKKDKKSGKESNRGFVERQLGKLKADKKTIKKTPGIV